MSMKREKDFYTTETLYVCEIHCYRGPVRLCPYPNCPDGITGGDKVVNLGTAVYHLGLDKDRYDEYDFAESTTYVRKKLVIGSRDSGGVVAVYNWYKVDGVSS